MAAPRRLAIAPALRFLQTFKRMIAMVSAALDEGRTGSLERQHSLLVHIYVVLEAAAKDPAHELAWGWPLLGIADPEGRPRVGWAPAEVASLAAYHKEEAVLEAAKKALGERASGSGRKGGGAAGDNPIVAGTLVDSIRDAVRAEVRRVKGVGKGDAGGKDNPQGDKGPKKPPKASPGGGGV